MIIFLYGQNSFLLREKVRELKAKYLQKSPGLSLEEIYADEIGNAQELRLKFDSQSLFATKRLIIIKNIFSSQSIDFRGGLTEMLKGIINNADTILVITENFALDKREKLFKSLVKSGRCQEFKELEIDQLEKWIGERVQERGGNIREGALKKLIFSAGFDLETVANEIEKLVVFAMSQGRSEIIEADIDTMVKVRVDPEIFSFIESIAHGRKKEALEILNNFYINGENENYLMSMIAYQFRTLISIVDLKRRKVEENTIAKIAGFHPFVVAKSLPILTKYSWEKLLAIYGEILNFDLKMKTGRVEPRLALDLLVAKLMFG